MYNKTILAHRLRCPIKFDNLYRMRKKGWLSSNNIGYAWHFIKRRHNNCPDTFCWPEMYGFINHGNYNSPWSEISDALTATRYIHIPCNIDNIHWILIVMDMKQKTFRSYDSKNECHEDIVNNIKRFFGKADLYLTSSAHLSAKRRSLTKRLPYYPKIIQCQEWRYEQVHCPHQTDGYNCGIFTVCFAECLTAGIDIETVTSENIKFWRDTWMFQLANDLVFAHRNEWKPFYGNRNIIDAWL